MMLIEAATDTQTVAPAGGPARYDRATGSRQAPAQVLRAIGALGLLGVLATLFLLVAGAAGGPSRYVPARSGGWPDWLAGPLSGVGLRLGSGGFQALMLIMCASYLLVLASARELGVRALGATIVLAHVVLLLGPPLISQDVFGYLAFARLGALHGLDPYTHFPAAAPTDAAFPFVGWPFQHSPYGPLFTLVSYATTPLGLAGGLWAMKALAVSASLATVGLSAKTAEQLGRSPAWAAAFVGLNPVLLVLAVGGAHNDMLLVMLLALALWLATANGGRPRAAAVALAAGVGVKVSAGLVLPFLVLGQPRLRQRLRTLWSAVLGLAALVVLGLVGFGLHTLGFLVAIGEQQQLVATHSLPAETARLFSLGGTPAWWRDAFLLAFVAVLAGALWRTYRGADWIAAAGWATLALLLCTAWLLPWYAVWLLPLAAVCTDRRLRAATLLFCAYAVLIHLPLADPLLRPVAGHVLGLPDGLHLALRGERVELTRFEVLRHAKLNLGW